MAAEPRPPNLHPPRPQPPKPSRPTRYVLADEELRDLEVLLQESQEAVAVDAVMDRSRRTEEKLAAISGQLQSAAKVSDEDLDGCVISSG